MCLEEWYFVTMPGSLVIAFPRAKIEYGRPLPAMTRNVFPHENETG